MKTSATNKLIIYLLLIFSTTLYGQNNLSGVHGIDWGTTYGELKEHFRSLTQSKDAKDPTYILQDIENEQILTKKNGIKYRYRFYIKPEIIAVKKEPVAESTDGTDDINPAADDSSKTESNSNARFYFMETIFSYIPAADITKKIVDKYGNQTRSTVNKEFRGANIWELGTGYLIQWVEPYDEKPFTKSLYYISNEIMKEIKQDYEIYKYAPEMKIVRELAP